MTPTTTRKGNGKAPFPPIPPMADETEFWRQFNAMSATIARIDERQTTMARDMTRLLCLEDSLSEQRQRDLDWRRGIEDRLKAIEGAGIAGWSWKKLGQAAALIGATGMIFGAMFQLARWIASHWK